MKTRTMAANGRGLALRYLRPAQHTAIVQTCCPLLSRQPVIMPASSSSAICSSHPSPIIETQGAQYARTVEVQRISNYCHVDASV